MAAAEKADAKSGPVPMNVRAIVAKLDNGDVVHSHAALPEDTFRGLYETSIGTPVALIEPPYAPERLQYLTQTNNALSACIEAMVNNVDGTGAVFEPRDGFSTDKADDQTVQALTEFFNEVFPGQSFLSLRKKVRRDIHAVGWGVIEVIRNAAGEIVFLRHADAKTVRYVVLDEPVMVDVTVKRGGQGVTLKMPRRERRFAQQLVVNKVVYFKEFGASRDLDKSTGVWAQKGRRLALKDRATEFLVFGDIPDALTPYHVPRWVPQMPSVLGSRKAEELNLEFFNAGGIPPLLIILQGGSLVEEAEKKLEQILNGSVANKLRAATLEAISNEGSLDRAGQVKVTVERFGSERQQDSMFENYDARCEVRVRRAFRLPSLFLGASEQASFATAYTSYTLTEAQVFLPERQSFDEVITTQLLPAMGYGDYKYRSLPLQVNDATLKLQAVQVANATGRVDPEDVIDAVNEFANLSLKVSAKVHLPPAVQAAHARIGSGSEAMNDVSENGAPHTANLPLKHDPVEALAHQALATIRKRDLVGLEGLARQVLALSKEERQQYKAIALRLQFTADLDQALFDAVVPPEAA